jgi:hypothetical protein
MTEAARATQFKANLGDAFTKFNAYESQLRVEYARETVSGDATAGEVLLERVTRRFLVDPVLRALGWDPDDAERIAEEARGHGPTGKRFYFDYLGKSLSQLPVLLVEAKHCDTEFVRVPHGLPASGREASRLLSEALDALKRGQDGPLLSSWREWLKTLRNYVLSLDEASLANLRRVVITAGSWMVIFEDPRAAFTASDDEAAPDEAMIHCFASQDEIRASARNIFRLLDREHLVDTLRLTLSEDEALRKIPPASITRYWRGIIVATRVSGSAHRSYPTRSVYPALILESGDRIFGVARFALLLEEPRDQGKLDGFLVELRLQGEQVERDLLRAFGRSDLSASPLADFPPYRTNIGQPDSMTVPEEIGQPATGSEATRLRGVVRSTGEPTAIYEFLVVTGQAWFYKLAPTNECLFHSFREARAQGVSALEGRFGAVMTSYTETDQPRHCEHSPFRLGLRAERCEVASIETHLCCKTCLFEPLCWEGDTARRPCPS